MSIRIIPRSVLMFCLVGLLTSGLANIAYAQESEPTTGSLVVVLPPDFGVPLEGIQVGYEQISHDFLIGYDGPLPVSGLPEMPFTFNLVMECIPWLEIEPVTGVFTHASEETASSVAAQAEITTGNDCLLYFGREAQNGWPEDLEGLAFDAFLKRAQIYLEHAVRYESARGINLFVIKEPAYPTADPFDLTRNQWLKLVHLACQTIRTQAPRARIVIEVIAQYLPDIGYKPYTFLNDLIREGANFDGIMMVFSRPIATYVSNSGYPHMNWVSAQVAIYSDLGKQMYVRFSGIPLVGPEAERQAWLEEMYSALFNKSIVVGIFWDEVKLFPARLFEVAWPARPAESRASAGITLPMLNFISDRTSTGILETDASGQAVIYGYAGDYLIRVEGIGEAIQAHIYRGQERRLELSIPVVVTEVPAYKKGPTTEPQFETTKTVSRTTTIGMVLAAAALLGLGVAVWVKDHKTRQKSG